VITDAKPRSAKLRRQFEASDAQLDIPPPPAQAYQKLASRLERALATGHGSAVKKAGEALLLFLAKAYAVEPPKLKVLGARPQKYSEGATYELWGDYTFATRVIRLWMRTAVLAKVTSFRGLLNALLHEFCHHLDREHFSWSDTPHTRGFFGRVDGLYHLALATRQEDRRPLAWVKSGSIWRINWNRMRGPKRLSGRPRTAKASEAP
jgi:hypothetical protein